MSNAQVTVRPSTRTCDLRLVKSQQGQTSSCLKFQGQIVYISYKTLEGVCMISPMVTVEFLIVPPPPISVISAKIRRLYDISNVLSSLKLIKKVHVTEERGRKPAFKWTGPENLPSQGRCHIITLFISLYTSVQPI